VREPDELKEGQIDGAISLPLGRLIREAKYGDLDEIKRKKSVLTVQVDTEEILLQTN